MSEAFYIKYDIATRWEGKVHYVMAPPYERIDALMPLLLRMIQSETDPSGEHVCPTCGQAFKIDFHKIDLTTDPLTISTFCKTCNIHIFFRSDKVPIWAKEWPKDFPEVKEFFKNLGKHGQEYD